MESNYTKKEIDLLALKHEFYILYKLPSLDMITTYFLDEPLENMPLYLSERGVYGESIISNKSSKK